MARCPLEVRPIARTRAARSLAEAEVRAQPIRGIVPLDKRPRFAPPCRMFELTTSDFGGLKRYSLFSPTLGHGFDVVPGLGANVTAIRFGKTNVIDGYETGEELRAGKWGKSAILFPFPNRLRDGTYEYLGREYVFPLNNAPMGNAIHGFVRHESFEVERIVLTKESAEITARLEALGTNASYPFPFTFDVTFGMTEAAVFSAKFVIKNKHHEPIPAGLGWHPYFRLASRADEHRMRLPPCERVEIDERMIPTGARSPYTAFREERDVAATSLDTCFHVEPTEGSYKLSLVGSGQTISIEADRASFPYFQVFTPDRKSVV